MQQDKSTLDVNAALTCCETLHATLSLPQANEDSIGHGVNATLYKFQVEGVKWMSRLWKAVSGLSKSVQQVELARGVVQM